MAYAAHSQGIPLSILYSVGLTETGRLGTLKPYDMNVDGVSIHNETLAASLKRYREERARGASLIDIGCMQINVRWHGARFKSIEEMFDPRLNVQYAARFLKELRARHGTWTLALARYNAGPDNNSAQRAYVCTVARQLVTSGMGGWTESARQLCGSGPGEAQGGPGLARSPGRR